jgi:uncharacterized hydrophobic protein (TIGR00271 family)
MDTALLGWLRIDPATKPRVYARIFASADLSYPPYWLEIFFAAGIATLGLVLNSPAVIIGAMLISPLMGPIMAMGLALASGNLYLGIKAALNLTCSVVAAVAFSGLMVWLLPFNSVTSEILARTNPNLLDLGVALLSGLAGSVAVARSGAGDGDDATALPGVAIAVALMPPLCTIGFGLGSGRNLTIMAGAGLLFLTNLVAIVASAFMVFLLIGMEAPGMDREAEASRSHNRLVRTLLRGPVGNLLAVGGRLRWRVLMIVVVLGSLAVPLRKALMQVAGETVARGAVQSELRRLAPAAAIVSEQVQIEPDRIGIRVISTQPITSEKAAEVRKAIERRSGRTVDLSIDAVASMRELAGILDRVRSAAPPPPVVRSLGEMHKDISTAIQPALQEIWPLKDAPLETISVDLGAPGIALKVQYQASADLDEITEEVIQKSLRARLGTPGLAVTFERVPPPRPVRGKGQKEQKKAASAQPQ